MSCAASVCTPCSLLIDTSPSKAFRFFKIDSFITFAVYDLFLPAEELGVHTQNIHVKESLEPCKDLSSPDTGTETTAHIACGVSDDFLSIGSG
jgi:hypothetical protein